MSSDLSSGAHGSPEKKKNVGFISLGCDKNRVDTEKAIAIVRDAGYRVTDDVKKADIIVINTCAFIKSAVKEAVDTVLEVAAEKKEGAKIVVAGCFTERYAAETAEEFSEVDAFVGMNRYAELPEIFERLGEGERLFTGGEPTFYPSERVLTTPPHYAYLKIAEGCSNHCTYCTIPSIRGKFRSEPQENLVKEATRLAEEGVKELIVVAQDTTRYGSDLGDGSSLVGLLKKLCELDFSVIRLLYAYPESVTDELIDFIADEPKMAKYLDIPLQHVSDAVLKRMGRRTNYRNITELIKKLRSRIPGVTVRSTFIVGFPGESEEDFEKLRTFIGEGNVDYAGFFAYSREEGTAAAKMGAQIPYKVKVTRRRELEKEEARVVNEHHQKYLGQRLEVVYENIDLKRGRFVGRTVFQAPEVDPVVSFTADFAPEVGTIYIVKITRGGFYMQGKALKKDQKE